MLLFALAFLFRLVLSLFGANPDIFSLAGWSQRIYNFGAYNFYENNVWIYSWPSQAPIFNLIMFLAYWGYAQTLVVLLFIKHFTRLPPASWIMWWEQTKFLSSNLPFGLIIWIKFFPILTDLTLGVLIFKFGQRLTSFKKSISLTLLFLFLPFSWYLSSFWGQYDQLVALLILLSFLLLYKKYFALSALLFLLSVGVKPTTSIFLPFYLFFFFKQQPQIKEIVTSLLTVLLSTYLTTLPFTPNNPVVYLINRVFPKVASPQTVTGLDRLNITSIHSFTFWQMLFPQGISAYAIFLVPLSIWASLIFLFFYLLAIFIFQQKKSVSNLLLALYLISASSYLFFIGQLDRYFYPSLIFLLLLVFYYPKLLRWWILSALIFSFNLYYSWGFPFTEAKWSNDLVIRIFSLSQVIIFYIILRKTGVILTLEKFLLIRFRSLLVKIS